MKKLNIEIISDFCVGRHKPAQAFYIRIPHVSSGVLFSEESGGGSRGAR